MCQNLIGVSRFSLLTLIGLLGFSLLSPSAFAQPIAVDDSMTAVSEVPGVLNILDNDIATEFLIAPSTVLVIEPPEHGQITIDAMMGYVMYESDVGFVGTDTFEYVVADMMGNWSNVAEVTITVVENLPPSITAFGYETGPFGETIFFGTVTDEEMATLEFTVGGILTPHIYVEPYIVADANGDFTFSVSLNGEEGNAYIQAIDSLGQMSNIASVSVVN